MIHFEVPKNQSSILKVIGVGGGGGNAVNYMYNLDLEGVDFIVCNTDSQALALSPVPNKIQLGPHLTQGLGAGANPEIGKQAGEESMEDIAKMLKVNTKMAFITAGMGGGTGTGGAPVVAKVCRDLGILTVGIVTTPFSLEGRKRMKQAQEGIDRMREHVDTILIISNDKLRQQFGNLPFTQAFSRADDVLATAAKCITDIITSAGQVNLDFADVTTVMKSGGVAILGNASFEGENRAMQAVEGAINSPLLNDSDINGAKWILLNVNSAQGEFEHTLDELEEIQAYVQQMAGDNCDIIMGQGHDPALGAKIGVTVIATGFNYKEVGVAASQRTAAPEKIEFTLGGTAAPVAATPNVTIAPTVKAEQRPATTEAKPADAFMMQMKEKVNAAETTNDAFQMVIKDESKPAAGITITEEQDDKARFDEQKRQFEERAERLRKLSFNLKGGDSADELENVPAYMRRNVTVDNNTNSSSQDTFLSGYSIGVNDQNNSGAQATIQTINTFLDGKKPD